jgi:hypothetical protein
MPVIKLTRQIREHPDESEREIPGMRKFGANELSTTLYFLFIFWMKVQN